MTSSIPVRRPSQRLAAALVQWNDVSVLENAIKPRTLLRSGRTVEEGRRDEVGLEMSEFYVCDDSCTLV